MIRFGTFKEGLAEDTEKQLKAFVAEGKRALVLDLRDNGGGDLDEAERVADLLLRTNKESIRCDIPRKRCQNLLQRRFTDLNE